MPVERIAPARAHGHVRAGEVVAGIAQPPFDNSAMDGFALRHADLHGEEETTLQLVGEQFAGHTLELGVDAGQCVRITTGAPLPAGADTVVLTENTRLEGERAVVHVAAKPGPHAPRTAAHTPDGARVPEPQH